jgi:transcriptional regulator with XRE-family HTH domain
LARNVGRLRRDHGWNQKEFAERLDISQQEVSLIETGRANPTLETLEALATGLRVEFEDLFKRSRSK